MFRIKELRLKRKLSMRQVAKDLDIPYTTYISYEKETHEPNSEILIRIADYFNCSIDYLIGRSDQEVDDSVLDKVAMIDQDILGTSGNIYQAQKIQKNRDSKKGIEELFGETVTHREIEHIVKYRSLDEYGKKAVTDLLDTEYERCSSENDVTDLTIELPMPELPASAGIGTWLEDGYNTPVTVRKTKEAERANVVIKVSGDSMEPLYTDGDKVLVKIQPDVEPGEIGIFIVDSQGYIKKKGDHELISVNPEYDNIKIAEYTDYRCFGKVLGKAEIIE